MDNKMKDKWLQSLAINKKKIILNNAIDKNIIGGVLLKVENKIIDGTIKGQLQNMKEL